MKKRLYILVVSISLIVFFITNSFAIPTNEEVKIFLRDTSVESLESSDQTAIKITQDNTKEISNLPSFTTKTGATGKEVSLLKILSDSLLIATVVKTFILPDSIHLTEINNLQYNTIENYIILDSASSLESLDPINYKLNNIGKTKIQLDGNNKVQFVETELKDEKPQEFTSPFNDKDSISITPKKNTKLKVDTSKENKLGIQAQDSQVEFKPKDNLQKKKLIFTIKNGEIIVSEDNGFYKIEGNNILTSFESISFKQFLDKTKEVEFNSEETV